MTTPHPKPTWPSLQDAAQVRPQEAPALTPAQRTILLALDPDYAGPDELHALARLPTREYTPALDGLGARGLIERREEAWTITHAGQAVLDAHRPSEAPATRLHGGGLAIVLWLLLVAALHNTGHESGAYLVAGLGALLLFAVALAVLAVATVRALRGRGVVS